MSEGLVGKITGAGGRTFIFSGVLPAVILVGGWTLLCGDTPSLITTVQGLTKGGEQSAESIKRLLWFCVLTLLFYAGRGPRPSQEYPIHVHEYLVRDRNAVKAVSTLFVPVTQFGAGAYGEIESGGPHGHNLTPTKEPPSNHA